MSMLVKKNLTWARIAELLAYYDVDEGAVIESLNELC